MPKDFATAERARVVLSTGQELQRYPSQRHAESAAQLLNRAFDSAIREPMEVAIRAADSDSLYQAEQMRANMIQLRDQAIYRAVKEAWDEAIKHAEGVCDLSMFATTKSSILRLLRDGRKRALGKLAGASGT